MPTSEQGKAMYLGSLSIVSALLINEVEEMGSFTDTSNPPFVMYIVLFCHSLGFWSLFYSIIGAFVSYFFLVYFHISEVDVILVTILLAVGMLSFMIESAFWVIYLGWSLGTKNDILPESARLGTYLSYAIPQYVFYAGLPFMLYFYYRFADASRLRKMRLANVMPRKKSVGDSGIRRK